MGIVKSKTRSLGQILEKPFVRSRGQNFTPNAMKPGQNVYLDNLERVRKRVMYRTVTIELCTRIQLHVSNIYSRAVYQNTATCIEHLQ